MAAVAVLVVDVASRGLLRIQAELSVGFTALYFASGAGRHHDEPATYRKNQEEAPELRDRSVTHQEMDLQ